MNKHPQGKILFFILLCWCILTPVSASAEDTLVDLCRLRQRCAELTDNTDHRETLLAAEKLFEESTLQKNELYEAYGLYYIGISHLLLGRAEEGHKNLNRAMEIAERIENDTLKVNIYNSFGIYEANKNNHILATDYFYKALEHALRLDDELRRSKIEINLAHMFQIRKDTTGYKYTADAYSWGKKHGNHNLTICAGYYCAYFRHLQGRNTASRIWPHSTNYTDTSTKPQATTSSHWQHCARPSHCNTTHRPPQCPKYTLRWHKCWRNRGTTVNPMPS